jgi:hypothetical protein
MEAAAGTGLAILRPHSVFGTAARKLRDPKALVRGNPSRRSRSIVWAASTPKKQEELKERNIMRKSVSQEGKSPPRMIDERIRELGDWRGEMLSQLRALIKQADPEVVEEWKWRGVPVWYHGGMICTGETYKNVVKMTFAKGAALEDPSGLFNSSLDGNTRRAIDFREGEKIDEESLKALIRAAVALNASRAHG